MYDPSTKYHSEHIQVNLIKQRLPSCVKFVYLIEITTIYLSNLRHFNTFSDRSLNCMHRDYF